MKRRSIAFLGTAAVLMLTSGVTFGARWGFDPDAKRNDPDAWACTPPVDPALAARLYSYQVPVLIRNEAVPGEDYWAYADACVKTPDGWSSGQPVDWGLREGRTWGSFAVYSKYPDTVWQATFPPNETERSHYAADNISVTGSAKVYVPAFGPYEGVNPPVSLVNAPSFIPVGVSQEMAQTLWEAGLIVEGGRVWSGYSAIPDARAGRYLRPYRVMARWAPAAQLLCDLNTRQKRYGNDPDAARTLMIRNPAFPWELAEEFDCLNASDKDAEGRRKWGGGIVVYHLFPNLQMDPLQVSEEDGTVRVLVNLRNESAAAGPVHLYYRWNGTGVWHAYDEPVLLRPYQNTWRGEMAAPFLMYLPGPQSTDTLTVLAWPDSVTGLSLSGPDLELATAEVLAEPAGLDRVFETYTVELTLKDNLQSAHVQSLFCGDLRVALDAPSSAPGEGFTFTVTAIRDGCESLHSVLIDADVNGTVQRQQAVFYGQTATVTFDSAPQYGESYVRLAVNVDPENLVAESNEENNWAWHTVLVEEEPVQQITCPTGEPPEKCFRSRLIN